MSKIKESLRKRHLRLADQAVKLDLKKPRVKKELKAIEKHFKEDGWPLSYHVQRAHLVEVGVDPFYVDNLLVKAGYKIRFSIMRGFLVIVK